LISGLANKLSEPLRTLNRKKGQEDFCFPGSSHPERYFLKDPTLVHAHNLFPDFFDLRSLKKISAKYPLLISAHDCWLMTGHCAHPFDCNRFQIGCGNCPDLLIPPSIQRDNTIQNLKVKNKILTSSKPYLATPCEWLKQMFLNSKVGNSFQEIRVINNGVNTDNFFPISEKKTLRRKYGLCEDSLIFSFVGNKTLSNPWKNFSLMLESLQSLARRIDQEVNFLCIGENGELIESQNFKCHFFNHMEDVEGLNELYNCSDYYIHLAKADTFPNTILEAQSCGLPVFANPVCGIPEQILENKTGWFLKSSQAKEISTEILARISNCDYEHMAKNCRDYATTHFTLEKMISEYKKYYSDILIKQTQLSRN
jgi:glycosyltransferase involved in cell wall biosynthesis